MLHYSTATRLTIKPPFKGDPDGAELAINNGAWDYIEKTSSAQQIMLPLIRALDYRDKNRLSKSRTFLKREGIIGNSPKIQKALEKLEKAAISEASVLITGETGTGKELFARAIHLNSKRESKEFVIVDCAALPETLIESILFGHVKGSFSGADKSKIGLIQEADGGSLFLDEVGELPLSVQKTFLRVLQERRYRPVGSQKEMSSDFRLVAATNRNLEKMVKEGNFRQDLLFRLKSIILEVPPLRERKNDILDITMHVINSFCEQNNVETRGLSPDFINSIKTYSWPGNVRELINALEHVFAEAGNEPIFIPFHLPTSIRAQVAKNSVSEKISTESSLSSNSNLVTGQLSSFKDAKEQLEKEYFKKLMILTKGNKNQASQLSGLSRRQIYNLLEKYGI